MHSYRVIAIASVVVILLVASACHKADTQGASSGAEFALRVPSHFPSIPYPEGNEYTLERWKLGKKLFYDPILSKSQSISCGTCHIAGRGFSDTVALSIGDGGALGTQNAPTLTNVAYQPYYTRAGGVATLEMQVLVPIQEHNEFNTNIVLLAERLRAIPEYVDMSLKAYDREPDAYVITRALSNFERTLISGDAPYDQYKQGKVQLSESAIRGEQIFFGEQAQCADCHSGFNFTNYSFENNGLYTQYADSGRMRLTREESDRALFKVPTLRNISVTAPYMHDGSMHSLLEVVEHYNTGGANHPNKSKLIKPLKLSSQQKEDLVAFLHTLTDPNFISNKYLKK